MERNAWFTPQVKYNTYRYLGLDVEFSSLRKRIKELELENVALQTANITQSQEILALTERVEELETATP